MFTTIKLRIWWYNNVKRHWVYHYTYPNLRLLWASTHPIQPIPANLYMKPGKIQYKDYLFGKDAMKHAQKD